MESWASLAGSDSMPLFLLRDAPFRCISMAPREMVTCTHGLCCLRRALVLLVSDSEQTLLLVRLRLRVLDGGRVPKLILPRS